MIREIPPYLVETFWPLVRGFLERALRFHPHLQSAGLHALLLQNQAQLLVVLEDEQIRGAFVMEVQRYPDRSVGNVLALGTDIGAFRHHEDSVFEMFEQWCRSRNLDTLSMLGRAGWSKCVTRHGWQTRPSVIAWKELA